MAPPLKVLHFYTHFAKLGGVESVLRRQASVPLEGLEQRFAVAFEPGSGSMVAGLGFRPWHSPAAAARRWRRYVGGVEADLVVYHNAWGMPFLAGVDGAPRRAALFHSAWQGVERQMRSIRGMADAVWAVSEPLKDVCRAETGLEDARLAALPYPITPPADAPPSRPALHGRSVRLGYAGRMEHDQKRVERFPILAMALRKAGVEQNWEFLGEGSALPKLRDSFAALDIPAVFHGRKTGPDYWAILRGWDFFALVSDFEGTPIALLEALSQGVLPLCQRNASGSDALAAAVDPALLFGADRFLSAARAVKAIQTQPENEVIRRRNEARRLAAPHAEGGWDRGLATGIRAAVSLPRVSEAVPSFRGSRIGRHLPFALLGRLGSTHRWRNGLG
jgi:hypothetical protein